MTNLIPLTNQEIYKQMNKEIAFRDANIQFKIDTSNIVSTEEEMNYFLNIYSSMPVGSQVLNSDTFNFKRLEAYTFRQIWGDNFKSFVNDNPDINIRAVVSEEVEKMIHCQDPTLRSCNL